MKKRTKRFDDGGMASSGSQSAFTQPRNPNPLPPSSGQGLFSLAPDNGSGIGGVGNPRTAPGPLNIGQPVQQDLQPSQLQMRKGGAITTFAKGGSVKSRGDGCARRGKTKGKMR